MRRIGLTTTLPIEVLFAAGCSPLDLNNIFIADKNAVNLIEEAESQGFPQTICCWTKGVFSAALRSGIKEVAVVIQGDCINSPELSQVMELYGIEVHPFSYPYKPDKRAMAKSIKDFAKRFNVSSEEVEKTKTRLDEIRSLAHKIDELTYKEGKVTGFENHLYLVSTSDMKGKPSSFKRELLDFLENAKNREEREASLRLGYIGVPPICPDIYDYVEDLEGQVVFNEIQRQFSMPFKTTDVVTQYTKYTYPYPIDYRIMDIQEQIELRRLDGIIHYSQAFCSRQLDDLIFKKRLKIPILTIEADKPGSIEPKNIVKLEAFMDSLLKRKKAKKKV